MLAVKRVKLPASGWLNRQDKPLHRRGMFPVKICEIHSLGRYSREVLIGIPPPTVSQKDARKREGNRRPTRRGNGSCSRLIAATVNSSLINC